MLSHRKDPIIAIATAPGRGAVGIVRLSGPDLKPFIQFFFGMALSPRVATLLPFRAANGDAIDQGLAIYFPAPHSYTGEDVLELQAHGGPGVLQLLQQRCLELAATPAELENGVVLPQLRLARPGEFTERAFLNDKLDLVQAEAVADLINANTEMAARSASRSVDGVFSREIEHLQEALIALRMLVEATLDFPEEEIDFLQRDDAYGQTERILQHLNQLLQNAKQGALLREGMVVVIAGQPNAGKSFLLNALSGADIAIVTDIAGTTRDKVTQTIQIEGVPVHVIDTAGLRETADPVERIGVERAWQEIARADAVIFLHDTVRMNEADYLKQEALLHQQMLASVGSQTALLEIYNKCDLMEKTALDIEIEEKQSTAIYISAKTGLGLETLRQKLLDIAGWQAMPEGVFMARERHLQALQRTREHVLQAQALLQADVKKLELIAEELRLAQQQLSEITGAYSADDLLGVIFSQFCIGK